MSSGEFKGVQVSSSQPPPPPQSSYPTLVGLNGIYIYIYMYIHIYSYRDRERLRERYIRHRAFRHLGLFDVGFRLLLGSR